MKPGKKNILIVTRNFPPLVGGMERLLFHSFIELKKEYTCRIVGPAGSAEFGEENDLIAECPTTPTLLFL